MVFKFHFFLLASCMSRETVGQFLCCTFWTLLWSWIQNCFRRIVVSNL